MSRTGRNTLLSLASEVLVRTLLFALVVFASRTFGPAQFGKLSFAQAIVGYVLLLSELGFVSVARRDASAAGRANTLVEVAGVRKFLRRLKWVDVNT